LTVTDNVTQTQIHTRTNGIYPGNQEWHIPGHYVRHLVMANFYAVTLWSPTFLFVHYMLRTGQDSGRSDRSCFVTLQR
jgi:hypothetical protein